jgi:hypothetical protein
MVKNIRRFFAFERAYNKVDDSFTLIKQSFYGLMAILIVDKSKIFPSHNYFSLFSK